MSRHSSFWNKEYKKGGHLKLSTEPAEDLVTCTRWLERNGEDFALTPESTVLDIGTGNGRNLIFLSQTYGVSGVGIDVSEEALEIARKAAKGMPLEFVNHSINERFNLSDASVDFVLDMMVSHVLKEEERRIFRDEIFRVLKPGGWFLFKTHLKDGDVHSERLLRHHGTDEKNSYMHPRLKVQEHVWGEGEIREFFAEKFEIMKMLRSHKHFIRGKVGKRRTVSVYLRKPR